MQLEEDTIRVILTFEIPFSRHAPFLPVSDNITLGNSKMPAARQADVPVGLRRAEFATLTIRSTEGIFVSKSKTTTSLMSI